MTQQPDRSTSASWARFRFSVVGSLLSSPPARGELKAALRALAEKTWTHPVSGREVRFSAVTIERWYYTAQRAKDDPVGVLRRAVRKDCGKVSLATALAEHLAEAVPRPPALELPVALRQPGRAGEGRSGAGAAAFLLHRPAVHAGPRLVRKPRPASHGRPGEARAEKRREEREIRSYEAEYVGSLWHLDFHHGSLKVLTSRGQWQRPLALGILDDHSRLCCHLQWYLSETAEDLVHGLSQAIQKRGLPRALLTDNGAAMIADEVTEGLLRLGIVHEKTLPYSPYQNGKQECFWATLEGRLMEMLGGVAELSLEFLNEATQAWVEIEYNRARTARSPVRRSSASPRRPTCCARVLPPAALRDAFRMEGSRTQRQSDGTISVQVLASSTLILSPICPWKDRKSRVLTAYSAQSKMRLHARNGQRIRTYGNWQGAGMGKCEDSALTNWHSRP